MSKAYRPARTQTARDTSIVVVPPSRWTEFEVQAFIWTGLRGLGIDARGEVKCAFAGRAQVRFDIAVFVDGTLAGIVECKHQDKQAGSDWTKTRQGQRYAQFDVPVRLVKGEAEARALLDDAHRGQLWKEVAS